ncbi:MAG: 1-acyl-sn-glycerol-3-phosphate acyltransferase [Blastocatellia bacterium]|nr:1-acyl-sn-glycerol-3-phosphate acyltransferase [Blastocatellia bacterium]
MESTAQLPLLTRINARDMLEAIGLGRVKRGRSLLERICFPAAERFAREVANYDQVVGREGLGEGARWILSRNVARVEVSGQGSVPTEGPLLVVSNHPGLADAMALFASLPRNDLKVVAFDRPFLRALSHTSEHLIYMGQREENHIGVLRKAVGHLRRSGAVLIFPGGRIEPDPAVLPGAAEALERWSNSLCLIARLAGRLQIVPAIVSGVLSQSAQHHPVTRLRQLPEDRERLAAMLQIIVPAYRDVTVRVAFGPSIDAENLLAAGRDAGAITRAVIDRARQLIESRPDDWQSVIEGFSAPERR